MLNRIVRIALVILGVVGALGCAFAPVRAKDAAWPVLDATTLAWLGLVVVAYLLPKIAEITFGDTSLKLRDVDAVTSGLEDSVASLADLLQTWTESTLIYRRLLDATDAVDPLLLLLNYLRDRMAEARTWLSNDSAANVRISLRLYDAQADRLESFSNEIDDAATVGASFRPGEGLMGRAFLERRRRNELDARQVPGFVAIAAGGSYDAVMCLPVSSDLGRVPLGMLNVDKRGDAFMGAQESIGVVLAAQCAYALSERRPR